MTNDQIQAHLISVRYARMLHYTVHAIQKLGKGVILA